MPTRTRPGRLAKPDTCTSLLSGEYHLKRSERELWHEAAPIIVAVAHAGNTRLPARRVQREGIPATIAPGVGRPVSLFEHHMVDGVVCQIVADRKPGLSAAHDDSIHNGGHQKISRCSGAAKRPLINRWSWRGDVVDKALP